MEYPREFSPEARARVEAQRLRATRAYEQKRDELPSGYGHLSEHEKNLRGFILRVFLAFTHEACKLGEKEMWTVDRIRSEAEECLRRFTIEAEYSYGHDESGIELPKMISGGHLRPEIQREFQKSPEWHRYEDELLTVAEAIGTRPVQKHKKEPHESGMGSKRAEIDAFISKLADHGRKITRKNIWTVAGYKDRTEFERFQRGDSRGNQSAVTAFNRVLKMSPEHFLNVLASDKTK
jgi:hypothetical protein